MRRLSNTNRCKTVPNVQCQSSSIPVLSHRAIGTSYLSNYIQALRGKQSNILDNTISIKVQRIVEFNRKP